MQKHTSCITDRGQVTAMNLFEYEGKSILKQYDIPVPDSQLVVSEKETAPMDFPFVLKAQVMTGGRGKAGGVKVCHDASEYSTYAHDIINMTIKGHQVHGLLAEAMVSPAHELYMSITLQGVKVPTLIASAKGGMDIEQVAKEEPEAIIKIEIDPFTGIKDYQLRYLAERLAVVDKNELAVFVRKLQKAFFDSGATLTEINPLGVVDGKLMAMDAKVVLDNHTSAMQKTMDALEADRQKLYKYVTPEKEATTVTFVPLEGNTGLISDGAGTGMLTLDLLRDAGVEVSSFAELGGMTSPEVMYRAMELTFKNNPAIDALMVVLIGGFNRMDNMAVGLTKFMDEHHIHIPVYCRMCGTKQEDGIQIMHEHGLKTYDVLTETVGELVDFVKGGGQNVHINQ